MQSTLEIKIETIELQLISRGVSPNCTCTKCGERLDRRSDSCVSSDVLIYCRLCRWLLRASNEAPTRDEIKASGMPDKNRNNFNARQRAEPTPDPKFVRLARQLGKRIHGMPDWPELFRETEFGVVEMLH